MKHTHKKNWGQRIAAILLAVFGVIALATPISPAFAQSTTGTTTGATTGTSSSDPCAAYSDPTAAATCRNSQKALTNKYNLPPEVANSLITVIVMVTIVLKMLYALLVPIAGMIGKFMSNDWVTGTVFRLDILIETIWQVIRNLVNISIVLYLIYVAARNIVPFGDNGRYDIKQVLPRVALALVVVNFSLFFCRTVLSIANVTTTMAFSMPSQIGAAVFPGFSATPKMDANGTLSVSSGSYSSNYTTFTYAWEKTGADGKTTQLAENETPFNPFVWAEPLGTTESANLTLGCPKDSTSKIQTTKQADGVTTSQTVCVDRSGTVTPAPKANAGNSVYAMECLHKNYAFNFNDSLFSNTGPTLIANPGFDPSSQKYVIQPDYYKRILIQKEADLRDVDASKGGIDSAQWAKAYANKQAEVIAQTKKTGGQYPYYSDCIINLDTLAFSARNAMYVYAFNLLRIPSYEKSFTDIQSYSDVTVRILMAFFFLFMFFGVTIALLIAMVARTFYLWFMMALSPLWVLTDVLKVWKGDSVDQEGVIGGYGKFLALAFLPTVLGIILSVGFTMYHFLSYVGGLEGSQRGRFNVGSISLWFDPSQAVGGLGDLFATMFGIFALAALWVAVFAAFKFGFKSIKLASTVLENFNKTATGIAKFAAKTPLEAQVLPVGMGGQKISASTLMAAPGRMMQNAENERIASRDAGLRMLGLDTNTRLDDSSRQQLQMLGQSTSSDPAKFMSAINSKSDSYEVKHLRDQIMDRIMDEKGQLRDPNKFKDENITAGNTTYKVTKQQMQGMSSSLRTNSKFDEISSAWRTNRADALAQRYETVGYKNLNDRMADMMSAAGATTAGSKVKGMVDGVKLNVNGKEETVFNAVNYARSFDRSKNAFNASAQQAVVNAAQRVANNGGTLKDFSDALAQHFSTAIQISDIMNWTNMETPPKKLSDIIAPIFKK